MEHYKAAKLWCRAMFPLYDEKRSQTHSYRNVDPHFLGLRVYFVGTLERIQTAPIYHLWRGSYFS
jgi:hypothetical protein